MDTKKNTRISLYKHYKNKPYQYLGQVYHSETLEELVLYKALYQNSTSDLWVRPKKMFFDDVLINNKLIPRFKKVELKIELCEKINDETISKVIDTFKTTFTNLSIKKISDKIDKFPNHLLVNVYDDNQLVGFKIGYFQDTATFYSWLGAVVPGYQGLGIGALLINEQHLWCFKKGAHEIQTKTMNQWKSMIRLNLKNGFEITATEKSKSGEIKIHMSKSLAKC